MHLADGLLKSYMHLTRILLMTCSRQPDSHLTQTLIHAPGSHLTHMYLAANRLTAPRLVLASFRTEAEASYRRQGLLDPAAKACLAQCQGLPGPTALALEPRLAWLDAPAGDPRGKDRADPH